MTIFADTFPKTGVKVEVRFDDRTHKPSSVRVNDMNWISYNDFLEIAKEDLKEFVEKHIVAHYTS